MPVEGDAFIWSEDVRRAPAEPGVYELLDNLEKTIYIGKTKNLKETFTRYFDDKFGAEICKQKTKNYRFEVCGDLDKRYAELTSEYRGRAGRLPPCNESAL